MQPLVTRGVTPQLRVAIDPAVLAASRGRHPSSNVDRAACGTCGFSPPARADIADALRRLPSTWQRALAAHPTLIDRAAFLRDDLHAVANRVARLLAAPGTRLSVVTIHVPTALTAGIASPAIVVHRLRMAADRLRRLVEPLRTGGWDVTGSVGDGFVTVTQLVHVPLHHSHRDLASNPGEMTMAAVVPIDPRRRGSARHLPARRRVS